MVVEQKNLPLDYIYIGDVLDQIKKISDKTVRCIVTSPPYFGLRDYGTAIWKGGDKNCDHSKSTDTKKDLAGCKPGQEHGYAAKRIERNRCGKCGAVRIDAQIGLEKTLELYVKKLVLVFRECRRILTDDGTLWLNIGDSYWGGKGKSGNASPSKQNERFQKKETITKQHQTIGEKGYTRPHDGKHTSIKPKDLIGIPWMVAFALRADGWYLRSDIIWHKKNRMPESVTDRPTKSHEYIFLLSKSARYYYDHIAIRTQQEQSSYERTQFTVSENHKNTNGAPGQTPHTNQLSRPNIRSSGNKERKDRPGPEDNLSNQKGSVPWAGMTANKITVWSHATIPFKEAHFATYPEKLIVDCIKAGSSEHGRCSCCGKAYSRIVEKVYIGYHSGNSDTLYDDKSTAGRLAKLRQSARENGQEFFIEYKTIGWKKPCHCPDAAVVPELVFDPFMGAGTTALVAKKQHRNFIGIELNANYAQIAVKRLHRELGLFYHPQKIEV